MSSIGSIFELAQPQRRWFHIPTEKPIVTLVLLGIIILVYLPALFSPQLNELFLEKGALTKFEVINGEWWRLITNTFLHGPLIHIALNGYALYIIGMDLEAFFGRARFVAIYFISALAGSVTSFASLPYMGSSVGASGAIFGLVGALAVYFGMNHKLFGKRGLFQFRLIIGNIVVIMVVNIALSSSGTFLVDNWAHIGGLIVGAAVGFVLCPRYKAGGWINPLVRDIVNTNKSGLSWLTAILIGLDVIAAFFVILLLFTKGYIVPGLR